MNSDIERSKSFEFFNLMGDLYYKVKKKKKKIEQLEAHFHLIIYFLSKKKNLFYQVITFCLSCFFDVGGNKNMSILSFPKNNTQKEKHIKKGYLPLPFKSRYF